MKKYILYLVWIIFVAILAYITTQHNTLTERFYGIADTQEITINSDSAVEIRKIHVLPGEVVEQGELLVELNRPELTIQINEISHLLEELRLENFTNEKALQSNINELKAQKISKISEINYHIQELQMQYDRNVQLSSCLNSIDQNKKNINNKKNPLVLKIESLKKSVELELNPIQIRIDMFERELNSSENPLKVRIKRLEEELALLLEEQQKLYIYSNVKGIIGSINFKDGEKVSPFTVLLTLYTKSPSYVKGYINENAYNKISLNQKVKVMSLANKDKIIQGEVIGVGSRIIEYPERLRTMPDMRMWGREVIVKINDQNDFLLGEKVLVAPFLKDNPIYFQAIKNFIVDNVAYAEDDIEEQGDSSELVKEDITKIEYDIDIDKSNHIEASGVLYLPETEKYLVISDNTNDSKPLLYVMNDEGVIEEKISINGIDKIEDMEAIAEGANQYIYILCSQSLNKKGNIPDKRKLFVRIKKNDTDLEADKTVYLYDLLYETAMQNQEDEWAKFILKKNEMDEDIDIEGLSLNQGSAYISFKNPLKDDMAVIITLYNIDDVFETNSINPDNIAIWKEFDLQDRDLGYPTNISDLYIYQDQLFILSYVKVKSHKKKFKSGYLWRYDFETDQLELLTQFYDLKPEGITFNPNQDKFLIAFDNGSKKHSKIMKLQVAK